MIEIFPAAETAWDALVGTNYQVQFTANLPGGIWSDVGSMVTGAGGSASLLDSVRGHSNGVYRVSVVEFLAFRSQIR